MRQIQILPTSTVTIQVQALISLGVIGQKNEEVIDNGKRHNGEFISFYPIVDEGNY